jgi:hypothetical protein
MRGSDSAGRLAASFGPIAMHTKPTFEKTYSQRRQRALGIWEATLPLSCTIRTLGTDEFTFLNQPGQKDIQTELFYDCRSNVASYSKW